MKIFLIPCLFFLSTSVSFGQNLFGKWQSDDTSGFTARYALASGVLNGKIYTIAGHLDNPPTIVNTFEVFDPATHIWTTPKTTGTSSRRQYLTACAVQGRLYAIGGTMGNDLSTVEIFDPVYNSWTKGAPMPTPRSALTSCVVNNQIYVIGGFNIAGPNGVINTLEVYDPSTDTWGTPVTAGTFPGMARMTSSVVDGKIYVIGGFDGFTSINTLYVFDPSSNGWSQPTTTGTFPPTEYPSSAVINGKIYVIGGGVDPTQPSDSVYVFDPATNAWSTVITIGKFTPRFALTADAINGSIYALGGTFDLSDSIYNTNEVFTPVASDVNSVVNASDIKIYPNPTTGMIALHGDNMRSVEIVNILGENVKKITQLSSADMTIDLTNDPPGVYYAKCISDKSFEIKKIIKE